MIDLSIIVPVYNKENSILSTLDSIFEQGESLSLEVIVVNDGSSDESLKRIKEYKHEIVIIDQGNGGVSSARNRGIDVAKGKYIAFLDADDVLCDGALLKYKKKIALGGDVYAFGYYLEENGVVKRISGYKSGGYSNKEFMKLLGDFDVWPPFGTGSILIKREVVNRIHLRFNSNSSYGEDWEFFIKLMMDFGVDYTEESIYVYKADVEGSLSKTKKEISSHISLLEALLESRFFEGESKSLVEKHINCGVVRYVRFHLLVGNNDEALKYASKVSIVGCKTFLYRVCMSSIFLCALFGKLMIMKEYIKQKVYVVTA